MHRRPLPPDPFDFFSDPAVVLSAAMIASLTVPAPVPAQEAARGEAGASRAAEIVDTAREKRYQRWEDVDNYTVYGTFRGMDVSHHYEKITVDGRPAFRLVPPHEYESEELEEAGLSGGLPAVGGGAPGGAPGGPPGGAPDDLPGEAADALPGGGLPGMEGLPVPEGVQGATDRLEEARDAITDNPIGRAASGAATGDLQRNAMQRGMQGLMGGMQDDGTAEAVADARTEAMMFEALRREGRFTGTEQVDGRQTFMLTADDLTDVDLGAAMGEETDIRLRSAKIWLDTEQFVALKTEMEMIAGDGGQPMTIEVRNRDYRRVESLYEPFDRTIRSAGMMGMLGGNPEMRERMQQAREQMQKMEERLEQMPPAQRRMVERQMEQMGGMAGGGDTGMTIEMATEEIVVNQGPPTSHGRGTIVVSGGAAADVGRTIATVGSGPNPQGEGTLSMLQLMGGVEGEANDASGIVQLNIAGEFPEPGSVSARGGAIVQWPDGRNGTFRTDDAAVTVTSRTSRHIRGEYTMEAEGHLADDGAAAPTPTTVTVRGTFEAVMPRTERQGPAGMRPAPMMPGGSGMQP